MKQQHRQEVETCLQQSESDQAAVAEANIKLEATDTAQRLAKKREEQAKAVIQRERRSKEQAVATKAKKLKDIMASP